MAIELTRSGKRVARDHSTLIGPAAALARPHSKRAHLEFPCQTSSHHRHPTPSHRHRPPPSLESLPDKQVSIMSDHGEVEVESTGAFPVLPKDALAEQGTIKLFNKWSYEDVEIRDISLT